MTVTVTVTVLQVAGMIGTMQRLQALGVRLGINAFWADFSSVNNHQQLPMDILEPQRTVMSEWRAEVWMQR